MTPTFWKLSMGPGGDCFPDLLLVLDWLRKGLVLAHKSTQSKGKSEKPQGELFLEAERTGEYFYLCHGNESPSIVLLGQFTGPATIVSLSATGSWQGWAGRPFLWVKTALQSNHYTGAKKWWAPNHPSTFCPVPPAELKLFENVILVPYFDLKLSDF